VVGRNPDQEAEYFVDYCPVKNITPRYPATFLAHGDYDEDVPYSESEKMRDALAASDVQHELVTIYQGPHGFDRENGGFDHPTNLRVFRRMLTFLATHVGHSTPPSANAPKITPFPHPVGDTPHTTVSN
jgi:dipeptidyl aminopeptidase/acylaminoacyl peptidase